MKTNVELLNQLTKANKTYKLKLAQKAGFSSVEEYKQHLTSYNRNVSSLEDKVTKVTKQALTALFQNCQNKEAKISFNKKLDVSSVFDGLKELYQNTKPLFYLSSLSFELPRLLKGEERLMNYTFHGKFDNNGFAYVTDLDQPENDNLRVINLDRINWIELDNVKYTL